MASKRSSDRWAVTLMEIPRVRTPHARPKRLSTISVRARLPDDAKRMARDELKKDGRLVRAFSVCADRPNTLIAYLQPNRPAPARPRDRR